MNDTMKTWVARLISLAICAGVVTAMQMALQNSMQKKLMELGKTIVGIQTDQPREDIEKKLSEAGFKEEEIQYHEDKPPVQTTDFFLAIFIQIGITLAIFWSIHRLVKRLMLPPKSASPFDG